MNQVIIDIFLEELPCQKQGIPENEKEI